MILGWVRTSVSILIVLLVMCQLVACNDSTDSKSSIDKPGQAIPGLSLEFLLGNQPLSEPLPTSAFTRPRNAVTPVNLFEGTLAFSASSDHAGIRVHVDSIDLAGNPALRIKELPEFSIELVQNGVDLIPVKRGAQEGKHPYWEFIPAPGKAWDDPGDAGWTRAALPFSLQERNQNCTHNGLLSFVFQNDGKISRVVYQLASETCKYMKVDLWGIDNAAYQPGEVSGKTEVVDAYRREAGSRMPVRPIEGLAKDYPGADLDAFQPPGMEDVSVYGFIIDDVHYRGGCQTRYGPHPFCDVIDLPAYSLSKSILGGLVFLYLEQKYPDFADSAVVNWVPECDLPNRRWDGVTVRNLLNMDTGIYRSAEFYIDEDAPETTEGFFLSHECLSEEPRRTRCRHSQ
jgi:hypothetical protein